MSVAFAPIMLLSLLAVCAAEPQPAAKPKNSPRLPRAPGVVAAHQDIDLVGDEKTLVRTSRAIVQGRAAALPGRGASTAPGYPATFASLKIGQAVKVVLVPRTEQTIGQTKSAKSTESVLVGRIYHLDAQRRKLTVRTEWLAPRGASSRKQLNKDYVKQLLADWRVGLVLVLDESPQP